MKFFLLLACIFGCIAISNSLEECRNKTSGSSSSEKFTEELLVKPLPTGHVYSHFEFTVSWATPQIQKSILNYQDLKLEHYDLFPRSLGEVIEKYHVRELHLTLTQGLWRHQKWGYPVTDASPGATLWVWFNPAPKEVLDQNWRSLVNALSGLFCASLNFIDATNSASPELSYRPTGLAENWYASNSSYLRYAALPRENVCTENLTPWKKLLPCDTKAGLASSLYPGPIYASHYHSLAVHFRPSCANAPDCDSPQLELVLSLGMVQHKVKDNRQDFTFRSLYSAPIFSTCPLASSSMVYIDVTHNRDMKQFTLSPPPDSISKTGSGASLRALAVYDLRRFLLSTRDPLNVDVRYAKPHVYRVLPNPPLTASRYIAGYGQEGGSIRTVLTNNAKVGLSVVYLELLPWYLRLYFHPTHHQSKGYLSQLVTARDRERGWVYESVVELSAGQTIELSLPFTRTLLKWLEYPPDANHGFYLPSATISVILPSPRNISVNRQDTNTLRDKLQVSGGPSFLRLHTETLLVSLPTPDFSMPYNVICLACTVVALAFGPIHNITTKRLTLKKIDNSASFVSRTKAKLKKLFGRATTTPPPEKAEQQESDAKLEAETGKGKEREEAEQSEEKTPPATKAGVRKRKARKDK